MNEINDILNCILKFDKSANLEEKGRYFETIQKDVERLKDAWEKEQLFCGHPPKQTYLLDGTWHCEKCGGKWESIANK